MNKKDDALKLAREALKTFHYAMIDAGVLDRQEVLNQGFTAATAIDEALAEQPEQDWGAAAEKRLAALKQSSKAIVEDAAVRAVHKMAENARELGLDYEPAQKQLTDEKGRPLKFWGGKAEQPAQDQGQSCYCPNCEALSKELAALKAQQYEPVAWMKDCADFWEHYTYISEASQENYKAEAQMWVEKLRTSPQPSKPLPFNKEDLAELDNGLVLAYKLGWKSAEEAHGIKE